MIISIEGPNSVGKTTLLPWIEKIIRSNLVIGDVERITSKPTGEDYEHIKHLFENPKPYLTFEEMDLLLNRFTRNQCQLLKKIWESPDDKVYLADRWITSSIVYTMLEYIKRIFYTEVLPGNEEDEEKLINEYRSHIDYQTNLIHEAYQYTMGRMEMMYEKHLQHSGHVDKIQSVLYQREDILVIVSRHTLRYQEERVKTTEGKPISRYEKARPWLVWQRRLYNYVTMIENAKNPHVYYYPNDIDINTDEFSFLTNLRIPVEKILKERILARYPDTKILYN